MGDRGRVTKDSVQFTQEKKGVGGVGGRRGNLGHPFMYWLEKL